MNLKIDDDGTPLLKTNALIPRDTEKTLKQCKQFTQIKPSPRTQKGAERVKSLIERGIFTPLCPYCGDDLQPLTIGDRSSPFVCTNLECGREYVRCPECGGEMIPVSTFCGKILKCEECEEEIK